MSAILRDQPTVRVTRDLNIEQMARAEQRHNGMHSAFLLTNINIMRACVKGNALV